MYLTADEVMARDVILLTIISCLLLSWNNVVCDSVSCPLLQENHQLVVSCSHAGLTSVPDSWPAEVTSVDLSYNHISSLRGLTSPEMRTVRQLNVSHNLLQTVEPSVLSALIRLESLDLSYNQLTLIHPHAFVHLTSLRSLKLHHNQLQRNVSTDTFQGLSSLQRLDLSHNQLSELLSDTFFSLHELTWLSVEANLLRKLAADALTGLSSLLSLDLSNNQLEMTSSVLPPGLFSALSSLRDLRLQNNDGSSIGEYPENVFNNLISLRYLAIDTFLYPYFGKDFAGLRQLETLDLGYNCNIRRITNETFYGFRYSSLRVILMTGCYSLISIEQCAFCNFLNLTILRITGAHYMNPIIGFQSLYGLQNQTMSEIDLSFNGNWGPLSFLVDTKSTRFLMNICVSTIRAKDSRLRRIKTGSTTKNGSRFSECIQHIDISENILNGDTLEFVRMGIFFPRIQTVQIQNQNIFSIPESMCTLRNGCTDHVVSDVPKGLDSVTINVPPTLVLANVSAVFAHLSPLPPNLTFHHAHNLRALDVSYNGMANCRSTMYGLERLETLELNFNYCRDLSVTLLDNLVGLKRLGLSNFGASQQFYSRHGRRFFQHLRRLEDLDLSFNQLLHLPADMLQAQSRLTHLKLSANRFQSLPIHLGYHGNLTWLDLSRNMLPTLTASERAALDQLASHHEVRVRLIGNPFVCTCTTLDMVMWLRDTPVLLDGEGVAGNYSCTLETGEMADTQQVLAAFLPHWRTCVGVKAFGAALGLFLTQLLLLVVSHVICSHWTLLRYTWKVLRRHQLPDRQRDFSRDAYLVYADTDRDVMWACRTLPELLRQHRHLRLLLKDVEELPTMCMAENIAQYIDMSWKIVLLVTQDFSRDEWACGFAVQQATRCITAMTPERVIVVFLENPDTLEPMPSLQLLLPLVPHHHIFHVHPMAPAHHPAWRALAEAIVGEEGA